MRKKIMIAAGVVLVLAAVAWYFFIPKGPDVSVYEFLKDPRIAKLPDQKMVVVTAKGDPNVVGGKAFKLLFSTYFKIPGVPRTMALTPRARWIGDMNVKSSWTGHYALPVQEATTQLPAIDAEPGYAVALVTWAYGDVAEILHKGPYGEEKPTIDKLHQYISHQGYKVIGEHEEEYIKGPGMFSAGDPKGYYTIIRLRVTQAK